ncbi:hypothetical protein PIROE2DRAFT_2254 [Piromyces sp. E2]|nr:hypothetical protein PIROE2DRAFT_2254 [Piromyces sp. E2]|eukprot:OUM69823.1 hypothetical protein PIROE2DRAFT_2254 [Piromyces sp. E2]
MEDNLLRTPPNHDENLPSALWALRTSKSSVTGFNLPKEENETEEYNFRGFLHHQKWVKETTENIQYAHAYWLERNKSVENMLQV